MWLTKYTGGAAAQGGAIYAQGDSFVYAQGLRLNTNSAPAIETVNNVTMLLNTTCFADNGDATTVRCKTQIIVKKNRGIDCTLATVVIARLSLMYAASQHPMCLCLV